MQERANSTVAIPRWRPFDDAPLARVLTGVVVALTVLVFLARIWPTSAAWLDELDHLWHDRMVRAEAAGPLAFAGFLEVAGGAWVTVPLHVVVAIVLAARGLFRRFRFWLITVVSAEILSLVLKALYDRPRPPDHLSHTINASFPSGHTTTAAVIGFGLAFVLARPGRTRLFAGVLAFLWTATMGWSRTYLRDHWLTDVLAGGALGLSCTLVAGLVIARRSGRTPERTGPANS